MRGVGVSDSGEEERLQFVARMRPATLKTSLRKNSVASTTIPAGPSLAIGNDASTDCGNDSATLRRSAEFYGLGLALGNGDVTLLELANGYREEERASAGWDREWTRAAAGASIVTCSSAAPEADRSTSSPSR